MIFLFSTILKILEIEVFNILYNPGIIGNFVFPIFCYSEKATGGRLQGLCCAALDYFWNMFLENEHDNLGIKVKTSTFFKMAP